MAKHVTHALSNLILILILLFSIQSQETCDIVIVGGTLASLGAAIHAPDSYKTCLIEPTSRLGGQLGDQGVWHIDFNWLYQKDFPDRTIAYSPLNIHPFLAEICNKCNTGDCWVSRNCFQYSCIEPLIKQKLSSRKNLTVYYDSMLKSIQKAGSKIVSLQIVQRLPLAGAQGARQDCRYFSQIVDDWYTRQPSQYYRKNVIKINVANLVIQASQYGDALVLSNASYMQGTENKSTCGQSIVFGVQQTLINSNITTASIQDESTRQLADDDFSLGTYTAEQVWRYRRLVGKGLGIKQNEISLQNWNGPGNDYKGGYLFIDAKNTTYNWKGGLNSTTLKQAELRSLRFHQWFTEKAGVPLQIYKNQTTTCVGTTRLPYIRDGRRSVGYKGFYMKNQDVTGVYNQGGPVTATPFKDRVAIGMYNMDLHSINNCTYGNFAQNYPLPFFLPLRAFSNQDIDNLITAGRAMAQQFFVSSATRTHATELASGAASMLIANFLRSTKIPSVWALINCTQCLGQLQNYIRQVMPIEWTISGQKYPQTTTPIKTREE